MSHSKTKRLYFFDNLRAFIILLMVVFHIAMGYTTWDLKWWYVNDTEHSAFFDLFVFSTDVYIMPVMFLIAVNILLLVFGIFMEPLPGVMILVPILAPIAFNLGIDPTHFAMVVIVNLIADLMYRFVDPRIEAAS